MNWWTWLCRRETLTDHELMNMTLQEGNPDRSWTDEHDSAGGKPWQIMNWWTWLCRRETLTDHKLMNTTLQEGNPDRWWTDEHDSAGGKPWQIMNWWTWLCRRETLTDDELMNMECSRKDTDSTICIWGAFKTNNSAPSTITTVICHYGAVVNVSCMTEKVTKLLIAQGVRNLRRYIV